MDYLCWIGREFMSEEIKALKDKIRLLERDLDRAFESISQLDKVWLAVKELQEEHNNTSGSRILTHELIWGKNK